MPCLGALNEREQRGTFVSRESGGEMRCSLLAWARVRGLRGRIGGGLFMSWGLSCQAFCILPTFTVVSSAVGSAQQCALVAPSRLELMWACNVSQMPL